MSAESKAMSAKDAGAPGAGLAILANYAAPCALAILFAIFAVFKPVFLSPDNLIGIAYQVSIIGIMAVGMTFVIMTGGIDLSVGSVLAVAGVASAELLEHTGSNLALSIAGGLGVAAAIGLAQGFFIAKLDLPPIVVTLAGLSIVRGAALLSGGPELHLIRGPASFLFIGSGQIVGVPAPVFIFAAVVAVAVFVQNRTAFGIEALAVGDNASAAFLSGLRIARIKTTAYVICALTAGLAGIIQASQVHTAAATYGAGAELDVIASVVLGGASLNGGSGSVLRTIFGVFLIGAVNNGLALLNVPIEMQLIAKAIVIVIALSLANREGLARR
jgi:ribose/xylose/arabinose/galactoside ABC-type transport system permease subunit